MAKLTLQQREFMKAFQSAVLRVYAPVCAEEIRRELRKSDSRVRSHLSALTELGFVCCVGRSRLKKYIPAMCWLEEEEADIGLRAVPGIGGLCERPLCQNKAADLYDGEYLCRECLIGYSDEEDARRLRAEWESRLVLKSSGGMLLDCGYCEDADGSD